MTIEARLYDANGHDTTVELERATLSGLSREQLLWVDTSRDQGELQAVEGALGLRQNIAALPDPDARPFIVRGDGSVRVRVLGLRPHHDTVAAIPVDFLAQPGLVMSMHDDEVDGLDAPIRQAKGETRLGNLDAGTFLALLLDELLTGYFDAVEGIEQRIDRLDVVAFRTDNPDDALQSLITIRREIAKLRRALAPQRAVFSSLTRPDAELEADLLGAAWPGLADRFQLAVEAVENARELLIGSFDIVMTRTGQRTNDVMRVLTVISAVLLPSIVLAGVMGMNFKPSFFDTAENFYVVIGAMLALAVVTVAIARWRRWL
jgi:Mg2+ and Co2+ transporter CorA